MDGLVQKYFVKGLAESTTRTYSCGQRRFLSFCQAAGLPATPASEGVLCRFVASLASEGLKHRSIKTYLAGVRHLHIREGCGDPFVPVLHRLHYVMRGIKRAQGCGADGRRERLPITPSILRKMREVWSNDAANLDFIMLWAACCLAFCGFLSAGEMTVPSDASFDPQVHLTWGDVSVDDPMDPRVLGVRIKASKTDPFRQGITIFLGKVASDLCPVSAVLAYMVAKRTRSGPLFAFRDGRPLTRQRFVVAVRRALDSAGVDAKKYAGHSFRIGAATTAAAKGFEDSTIQTLGRWKSLAYLDYIRIPRQQLASYTARLC